jgi:hypothetical protein
VCVCVRARTIVYVHSADGGSVVAEAVPSICAIAYECVCVSVRVRLCTYIVRMGARWWRRRCLVYARWRMSVCVCLYVHSANGGSVVAETVPSMRAMAYECECVCLCVRASTIVYVHSADGGSVVAEAVPSMRAMAYKCVCVCVVCVRV